jgi:hypothetical protein
MKFAKTLAMVACAGLFSVGSVSFARHAYAQDAGAGSWRTSDASSDDVATSTDSKAPPLDVAGCWEGNITDDLNGTGDIVFEFVQDESKPNKLENTSTISFSFDISSGPVGAGTTEPGLDGTLKGSVSSNGIKFSGKIQGCSYSGKGTVPDASAESPSIETVLQLQGKIKFSGKCAKGFKGMTFDIGQGCLL